MAGEATRPGVGYLLLPDSPGDTSPPDLARCCDLLGERAPVVEPDPPRGAWFALRGGKRAPAASTTGAALLALLDRHGYPDPRLAFAPTPGVARLTAHIATAPLTIITPDETLDYLAPISVEALGLEEDATDRLHLVGLHTLGTIVALPRGALGDYLGPLGVAIEALARCEDDRPLIPNRPPLVLHAHRDLDWPLTDRAMLSTLVARLATPPLAQLRRAGLGVTQATLALRLGDRPVLAIVHLPEATTDVQAIVAALLADADRILGVAQSHEGDETPEGITTVALTLTAPRALPARQASFFDVPQGRLGRIHAGIDQARRRGDGPVGYLRPVDRTYPRPDRRYALDPQSLPPEAAT
jgi:hypothetical protein